MDEVHALTDVTGFGLLGHLNEICLGSGLQASLAMSAVPLLPGVEALVHKGYVTGASGRNWAGYGRHISLDGVTAEQQALLTDPQTSGGLLVACAPSAVDAVLQVFRTEGFGQAAVIGQLAPGSGVHVRA
jgi:selenide,water dikinase